MTAEGLLKAINRGGAATRWVGWSAVLVVACLIAGASLPNGLPFGVVLLGLVLGALSALTAMGLVILYRSARIVNFAQAEIGGLAAATAVVMVTGWHLPYFAALPVGLIVALITGALVDLTVVRTLFTAPRLIVTVATIGLAQVIGAAELALPGAFAHLKPLTTFSTPFSFTFIVGPIVFNGNHLVAMIVVPVILVGLAWFFGRTSFGIAVRGAADSNDRALLLGIPVRRLSTITWVLAAGLSGVASMLSAPILGPQLGILAGPDALLAPLTAAVVARMESLTVAFGASLAIGVFQQAVFWSYPRSTTVEVALFVVVLGALLLQRNRIRRSDDQGLGGYVALQEVRPITAVLRSLPEVRLGRAAVWTAVALLVFVVPFGVSDAHKTLLAYMAIYGILAVSLVVLTGWSGQISLGQFAFAGIGAGTTASLFVNSHADLFLALFAAAVSGAVAAVAIGVPALRLPGLFFAVTTLAFAVPVSDYLLNSAYFPWFAPSVLNRPAVLSRFDLNSPGTFYYFCLAFLILAVAAGYNFRRSRSGRTSIAVRDNARGAASFGVSSTRAKLTAFAIAGAMAGVAGGLYVVGLRGIPFSGFSPESSLQVFTMVVIGGLGSLTGALVGAIYVEGVQFFLKGAWQLLATGGGILFVVQLFPAGIAGGVLYRVRDALLRLIAVRRGLSVPSLMERAEFDDLVTADVTLEIPIGTDGLLSLSGIDAAYGHVPVLFGVNLKVEQGRVLGLLGTNGAGKSTVLRVASGLLKPRRGNVVFDGTDITKLSPPDRVRKGLVTVPGGRGVFPSLTVAENLRLGSWVVRHDRAEVAAATERILDLFPALRERLDVPAGLLSGGEQQMLTIAQALYSRPRLLMIDELSLGLAPVVVSQLLDVIRQLASEGVTVLIVEQSLNLATSIAETSVFMERGQVRFIGSTADLADRPELVRAVFLGSQTRREHTPARVSLNGGPVFAAGEISRSFGGVLALEDVSFEAAHGEIVGFIGANGAGKTTLFDICSGFLPASRGRVAVAGGDVTNLPANVRAELGLGRVFQDARLFPSLTVTETLSVALERHLEVRDPLLCLLRTGSLVDSEKQASAKVDELIERFSLQRYRDAFVSELSTGTRRVVELACAVAHDPAVLLLDEPTSGIAQRESEALGQLILDLRAETGATFLIIEHDVPLVSSLADRLVALHLGRVISEGPPASVLEDSAVIEAYLGTDPQALARSGRTANGSRSRTRTRVRSSTGRTKE